MFLLVLPSLRILLGRKHRKKPEHSKKIADSKKSDQKAKNSSEIISLEGFFSQNFLDNLETSETDE